MTENSTSDWWRGITFDAEEVIKRIESPDLGFYYSSTFMGQTRCCSPSLFSVEDLKSVDRPGVGWHEGVGVMVKEVSSLLFRNFSKKNWMSKFIFYRYRTSSAAATR